MGLISPPIKLSLDTGVLFIMALLKDREPVSFLPSFKLKSDYFTSQEYALIKIITDYAEAYGNIPDKSFVEIKANVVFPEDFPTNNTLEFWAKEVRKRYAVETVHALTNEAIQQVTLGKLEETVDLLATATRIAIEGSGKSKFFRIGGELKKAIEDSKNARVNIRSYGVTFGFKFLDRQSGGAQPGDLITIAGLPGSCKTFTLQHMALAAYDSGLSVLFVPTEMSNLQYSRRFLALRNNLSINSIKFGKLSTTIGEDLLNYDVDQMEKRENQIYMADSSFSLGLLDVKAAAYEYKPDAIYIDGAYLLRPEVPAKSKYETVSSVAESLKILAKEMEIPIFATYQLNKRTEEIYQSAVVRQLSSIVIEMFDHKPETNLDWDMDLFDVSFKRMVITKGRDGEHGEIILQLDTDHTRLIEPEVDEEEMDTND